MRLDPGQQINSWRVSLAMRKDTRQPISGLFHQFLEKLFDRTIAVSENRKISGIVDPW